MLRCMKLIIGAAVLLPATSGPGASPPSLASLPPLDICAFKLVFAEEFKTLTIAPYRLHNGANWMAHTPWNGDFGDASFDNPGPSAPFTKAADGLRITASRDSAGRWHSGLLAGADATGRGWGVRYGYFEARMKLPPGPGTWPAFWLSSLKPFSDGRPSVEIDAMEYYGHMPAKYQAGLLVWQKFVKTPTSRSLHMVPVAGGALIDQWHLYGVRVEPAHITWYLDRKPVWQQPTPKELTTPLFPLVDLALGSGYPISETPTPSVLTISHIRIWHEEAAAGNMSSKGAGPEVAQEGCEK